MINIANTHSMKKTMWQVRELLEQLFCYLKRYFTPFAFNSIKNIKDTKPYIVSLKMDTKSLENVIFYNFY